MTQPKTIKVRITKDTGFWYKKGEIHEVRNCIVYGWGGYSTEPHFSKSESTNAIGVSDCEVLNMNEPHTIQIDGKEIELSEESYQNIKKHFKE